MRRSRGAQRRALPPAGGAMRRGAGGGAARGACRGSRRARAAAPPGVRAGPPEGGGEGGSGGGGGGGGARAPPRRPLEWGWEGRRAAPPLGARREEGGAPHSAPHLCGDGGARGGKPSCRPADERGRVSEGRRWNRGRVWGAGAARVPPFPSSPLRGWCGGTAEGDEIGAAPAAVTCRAASVGPSRRPSGRAARGVLISSTENVEGQSCSFVLKETLPSGPPKFLCCCRSAVPGVPQEPLFGGWGFARVRLNKCGWMVHVSTWSLVFWLLGSPITFVSMPVEIRLLLMGMISTVWTGHLELCSEVKVERKMSTILLFVDCNTWWNHRLEEISVTLVPQTLSARGSKGGWSCTSNLPVSGTAVWKQEEGWIIPVVLKPSCLCLTLLE